MSLEEPKPISDKQITEPISYDCCETIATALCIEVDQKERVLITLGGYPEFHGPLEQVMLSKRQWLDLQIQAIKTIVENNGGKFLRENRPFFGLYVECTPKCLEKMYKNGIIITNIEKE